MKQILLNCATCRGTRGLVSSGMYGAIYSGPPYFLVTPSFDFMLRICEQVRFKLI